MARATRENGKVPKKALTKGLKIFTVVDATIVDSLGAYCTAGQEAALNKEDATKYHKLNLVQAAMPDFDDEGDKTDEGKADAGTDDKGSETEAVAGANSGKVKP